MAGKGKPLRFAALIRVSTEKQEKQGESLNTQHSQIEDDVEHLGGEIVKWYGGQEHAMPGFERAEVDKLLADAQKRQFDAVIVTHADRWSRDNAKSKAGLATLRSCGIRFFVGTYEYDLFNPNAKLFLGMSAEIGEFTAGTQNDKSLRNRIERAKKGYPACGRRPFGRVFHKKTVTWTIDEDKHAMVKDIAKRYLAGESMRALADEYGVNHANLHVVMTQRCGDTWIQTFDSDELNIHEEVVTKVPRLLPEATIKAILKRAATNKTFTHGQRGKHAYLLRSLIFCEHCGFTLCGQSNSRGKPWEKPYYRHTREKPCPCKNLCYIPAVDLEATVMVHLFEMFGNPKAIERAIEAAVPDLKKIEDLRQQKDRLEASLAKIKTSKKNLVLKVAAGILTDAEIDSVMTELREQEARQEEQLRKVNDELKSAPSANDIREVAHDLAEQFEMAKFPQGRRGHRTVPAVDGERVSAGLWASFEAADDNFKGMSFDDKRALIEAVFDGKTPDGKQAGVYIEFLDADNDPKYRFSIRGIIEREKLAPRSAEALEGWFDDPEEVEWNRSKKPRNTRSKKRSRAQPPKRRSQSASHL